MKVRKTWACLLAAVAWLQAAPASANGRFPRAERLIEHPDDSDRLLLAATYGILSSGDAGASWQHICELSFGVTPASADPLLEVSSVGMLGGLLAGITLSVDGCDFSLVFGGGQSQTSPDISVDKSDRSRVLGLLKHMTGTTVVSELHQSLDGGQTFDLVGERLLTGFDFPLTVDSAPSDPQRIYVSGVSGDNVGLVLRSNDAGLSWEPPLSLAGTSQVNAPFIAAVDPNRADLLYVRTNGLELADQQVWAKDSLFIGDLTGEEGCHQVPGFCELFSVRAKLFGFALSPDGEHALLGLGDPRDPAFQVDARFVGLYSVSVADLLAAPAGGSFPPPGFKRVHSSPVSCVTWTATGIYVCTSQQEKGFALGFAPDLTSVENDDLSPLLDLTAVTGPLSCPAGSSTSFCGSDWEQTCQYLNACGNVPGPGGAAGADAGGRDGAGAGGVDGSSGSAAGGRPSSASGGPGSFSGVAGTDAEPSRADDESSGCSCSTTATARGTSLGVLLALPLLVRRRRRVARSILRP